MLTSTDIFGKVWKSSENHWKYSEVAGTFWNFCLPCAFDSEKVGWYNFTTFHLFCVILSFMYVVFNRTSSKKAFKQTS